MMTTITAISLLICLQAPSEPTTFSKCTVNRWHDADTFFPTIYLGYGITYVPEKGVRAFGYDAWEVDRTRRTVTVTQEEILKGEAALKALKDLVDSGELYLHDIRRKDPYGRELCALFIFTKDREWINVAKWMKEHGHDRDTAEKP